MPSEPTPNHRERARSYGCSVCALIAALLLVACEAPSVIRATPEASPEALMTPTSSAGGSPTSIPAPPIADGRRIERIAFAASVDRDGKPVTETSVFSESPEQMYLCVQIRDVQLGTQFRAYWFEDGKIIGQSDALATRDDEVVWVALGYRPIAALNPASEHSVELQIDTQTVDRFLFRVGVGDTEDVVAQAAFASGFDALGKPVDVRRSFSEDASELRLLARISRQIDPVGMIFTSIWYRGDTAIAYINPQRIGEDEEPDVPSSSATATPASVLDRPSTVLEFTYTPNGTLPRGNYRASILLNGTEVRSVPFEVSDAASAEVPDGEDEEDRDETEEPVDEPDDNVDDTPPSIGQLVITAQVDDLTSEPDAVNIWVWEGRVRTSQALFATFSVNDLAKDDDVRLVVERDGVTIDTIEIEHEAIDDGWVATEIEIAMPSQAGRMYTYTVTVEIDGESVAERAFEVWGVGS